MMKWWHSLIVTLAVSLCAPLCFAQEANPPAQQDVGTAFLAGQYANLTHLRDSFLDGGARGFRAAAATAGNNITEAQWSRVEPVVRLALTEASEIFAGEVVAFYAANNTTDDLQAAIAFYSTPEGARFNYTVNAAVITLTLYFQNSGRVPLDPAPDVTAIAADRLAFGRELSDLLMQRQAPALSAYLEGTTFGTEGMRDYVARFIASRMTVKELQSALDWSRSTPAARLEGYSAERVLAMQAASVRALRAVDPQALQQGVAAALRDDGA